jgi:uncharacterized protein (DUF433 family)
MDWREYIHSDVEVLLGKPIVKGTRLSVEFILGLFAAGWTEKQVLDNYPTLTPQSLRAVFALTQVDEAYHENLTEEKIDRILAELA